MAELTLQEFRGIFTDDPLKCDLVLGMHNEVKPECPHARVLFTAELMVSFRKGKLKISSCLCLFILLNSFRVQTFFANWDTKKD
jgi:hypothetical protein